MSNQRKTKIVATLGPACENDEILRGMLKAGLDIARINFSHGSHPEHAKRVAQLKRLREELGLPTALLADTKGPEVRLGEVKPGTILADGQSFTLTTADIAGDENAASVSYKDLPGDLKKGACVMIDDGLIEMCVESVNDAEIHCRVLHGGRISSRKGVNVPGMKLSMPYLSSRDRADLRFIVEQDFDWLAASFTRSAADILALRQELERVGGAGIRIVAKIENGEGVDNIDEIIAVSDGIMVARGDMGVEIALEEIPVLQKRLIQKAYTAGLPVITATQMLESMVHNPRPTRAEATDVANALYDGTSAIMLSGETAAGQYPIEAVRTMARIALRTEHDIDYRKRFYTRRPAEDLGSITNAISHATCTAAHSLSAKCIVTVTKSGETARMISKFRPDCPIVGCSPAPRTVRQMNLSWGVTPILVEEKRSTDELFAHCIARAREEGLIEEGDLVAITAGVPLGQSGTTNMLHINVVGEPIL